MDTTPVRNASTVDGTGGSAAPSRPRKRFELLEECRELILSRLVEIVAQALNQMSDELTAEALRSMRSDQQQALLDAVMLVRENRMEIEARFRRSFADVFERRLFTMAEETAGGDAPIELELVSDDVIRDKLSIDRLIGKARSKLDPEEVLGVRARFGALLEREWFEEARHPIAPEAVFEALKSALAELSPKPEVKVALLDAFEPHVSQNLNRVYADVNERLRAHHVLPRIRPQVVPVGSGTRRGAPDAAPPAGAPGGAPVPGPTHGEGPWVAGSFGVVQPPFHGHGPMPAYGVAHGHPGGASPAGAHPGGGVPGRAGAFASGDPRAGHAMPAGGTYAGPVVGASAADRPDAPHGTDPTAAGDGASYDDAVAAAFEGALGDDAMVAFERAMADASAGRPAGRTRVARMLSNPAMFGVADIPVAPVERPLVASLTALQRAPLAADAGAVMPEMTQRVREQGSPLDQITVEIVSMVFDYIYADRRLPDPIKQQLLRLQVVAVKAALLDRSFFARRRHPMRRLIDRISDVGADPDADVSPGAPLMDGLGAVVDRIIAEFDSELEVFDRALETIETLAREEAARREARIDAVAREAAMREALAIAEDDARAELARRIDKDSPAFVREFLHRWWIPVLARARCDAAGEAAEEAWRNALQTADWLVWSVAPKQSDEITRLATVLPGLIRGLNHGLSTVEIEAGDRAAFFDELLRAHTLGIAAAKKRTGSAAARATVSVKLQPDGTVRFEARAADPVPAAAPAPASAADTLLAPLRRGQRIELTDDEVGTRVLKLAWISPARKLFILSRHPDESLTLQSNEIAYMLQRGQARVVEDDSALDRAIGSVTQGPATLTLAPDACAHDDPRVVAPV